MAERWRCSECGWSKTTRPTFATKPTPRARSWHRKLEAAAVLLGTPFMPWQSSAGRLIGELRTDNSPRWPTAAISVPRQSGKTALSKSTLHARAELYENQRLFGTAQSRLYAVRHLENLALELGPRVKSTLGVGNERITWPNRSRYEVIAPTDSGGHGDSIDFMLIDEGWKLERHVLGGIRPAMSARPLSQMLLTSTMGTIDSEVWNELVKIGREATEEPSSRMAYIEYSAPDEAAVFDPDRWHEWMPALGRTTTHEAILEDMKILSPADFTRAYGNLTVESLSIVFPDEWVAAAWRAGIAPSSRLVVAVEVNEEPAGATVTGAHLLDEGAVAVRTLEWRYGSPMWVVGFVAKLLERRDVEVVVGDFGGPARVLHNELVALCERQGVALANRMPRDLGADTAAFHTALKDKALELEQNEHLAAAIRGAHRKNIGELWVPNRRRMMVDASPLLSAIMAFGMAREAALTPRLPAIW